MTFENPSGDAAPPNQPYAIPGQPYAIPGQPWADPAAQQWGVPPQPVPFAPVPEPKKSRTGLIAGVAVVAVLAVAGGVYAATSGGSGDKKPAAQAADTRSDSPAAETSPSPSDSPSDTSMAAAPVTIVLPAKAKGLTQMTGSTGKAVTEAMKKADAGEPLLADALFGAYEKAGSGSYFGDLTLVPLSDSTDLQTALNTSDAKTVIGEIADQAGLTDAAAESTSVSGGAITCGLASSSITVRMCIWIDDDEYGLAAFPKSITDAQGAVYSNALWQASEQS